MRTWWALALAACTPQRSDPRPGPGVDPDGDADTHTGAVILEDADGDGVPTATDCDDADPDVWPGAPEHCDGRLTDCDATTEDGLVTVAGRATFTDLQAALDAAADGDEVRICPGTWTGAFVAPVPVALIGQGGRDVTTLDADDAGPVLSVPPGSSVTGLTLTHGRAASGGGILLSAPGELVVADCTIRSNDAREGGGISVPGGSVLALPGTIVTLNTAVAGGGLAVGPGSTVDLTDAVIDDNRADYGGGLLLTDASVTGGLITENDCDSQDWILYGGGGVYASGDVTITGTEIAHNGTVQSGGGIRAQETRLTLVDVRVHDNEADGAGGGISVLDGVVALEGTTLVSANRAPSGGGIAASAATIIGGEVSDNFATPYGAGGIDILHGRLDGVVVRRNSTDGSGGGIAVDTTEVVGCTVEDNVAAWEGGGILVQANGGATRIIDTVVARNAAPEGGGMDLYVASSQDIVEVRDCTIVDNTADSGAGIRAYGGVYAGVRMRVAESALLRNVATERGGALVIPWWEDLLEVTVEDCDLGTSADNNAPDDVATGGTAYLGWGAGATFTCNPGGCTPQP